MFGMQIGRLGRVGGRLSDAQKILALFANSEPGAWYDPADLSTLFQDSAFTTPVTAVEQPVGGILDLSGRGNHASQATTTKRPVLKIDAGGRYYLSFDGVDDALQTGNIDFTGTDKMTVWAGVRVEDVSVPRGLMALNPGGPGAEMNMLYLGENLRSSVGSGGTLSQMLSVIAPVNTKNEVHTQLYDIAGLTASDQSKNRVDGVLPTQTVQAAGPAASGNFANGYVSVGEWPGYYFQGRLYSLITRGAQTSLSQIEATEAYIKQKMRLP